MYPSTKKQYELENLPQPALKTIQKIVGKKLETNLKPHKIKICRYDKSCKQLPKGYEKSKTIIINSIKVNWLKSLLLCLEFVSIRYKLLCFRLLLISMFVRLNIGLHKFWNFWMLLLLLQIIYNIWLFLLFVQIIKSYYKTNGETKNRGEKLKCIFMLQLFHIVNF